MSGPTREGEARASDHCTLGNPTRGFGDAFPRFVPRLDCQLARVRNDAAEVRHSEQTEPDMLGAVGGRPGKGGDLRPDSRAKAEFRDIGFLIVEMCYGLRFNETALTATKSEAQMENEGEPGSKRPLTALARVARRARIFARLREGWAYDEIARDERLTAERVRQIVREALERRLPDEDTDHAKLQLDRLQPAMRVTTEAVEEGDVRAIAPFLKVLDRLDRYQRTAKVNQVYDDGARKKLFEKLNRVAANLGLAVIEDPTKAQAKPAPEAARRPSRASRRGKRTKKTKRPGGSAEALEKARSGQENPRKSKPFPLIVFGRAWLDFAGFGSIWFRLGFAPGAWAGRQRSAKG